MKLIRVNLPLCHVIICKIRDVNTLVLIIQTVKICFEFEPIE